MPEEKLKPSKYKQGTYGFAMDQCESSKQKKQLKKIMISLGFELQASLNKGGGFGNESALSRAALYGHLKLIQRLFQCGANINGAPGTEPPLLSATILCEKKATVKLLIKLGADVNAVDSDGGSALIYATTNVIGGDDIFDPALDIMDQLLKAKANVNAARHNGQTALTLAATGGSNKTVIRLLKARADTKHRVTSGRHAGKTAAEIARHINYNDTAFLINAWPHIKNSFDGKHEGTPNDDKEKVLLSLTWLQSHRALFNIKLIDPTPIDPYGPGAMVLWKKPKSLLPTSCIDCSFTKKQIVH